MSEPSPELLSILSLSVKVATAKTAVTSLGEEIEKTLGKSDATLQMASNALQALVALETALKTLSGEERARRAGSMSSHPSARPKRGS